jgi:hypothetical protein
MLLYMLGLPDRSGLMSKSKAVLRMMARELFRDPGPSAKLWSWVTVDRKRILELNILGVGVRVGSSSGASTDPSRGRGKGAITALTPIFPRSVDTEGDAQPYWDRPNPSPRSV